MASGNSRLKADHSIEGEIIGNITIVQLLVGLLYDPQGINGDHLGLVLVPDHLHTIFSTRALCLLWDGSDVKMIVDLPMHLSLHTPRRPSTSYKELVIVHGHGQRVLI